MSKKNFMRIQTNDLNKIFKIKIGKENISSVSIGLLSKEA